MSNFDSSYEVFGFAFGGQIQIEGYLEPDSGKNGVSFGGVETGLSLKRRAAYPDKEHLV